MTRENQFVMYDKYDNRILEGEKFTFMYLEELGRPIELTGSFDWNQEELRYEIDIYNNSHYLCLKYLGNGSMYNFQLK